MYVNQFSLRLTNSRTTHSEAHGQWTLLVEVVTNANNGRQVQEPQSSASEKPNSDEDDPNVRCEVSDAETNRGQGRTHNADHSKAESFDEGSWDRAWKIRKASKYKS